MTRNDLSSLYLEQLDDEEFLRSDEFYQEDYFPITEKEIEDQEEEKEERKKKEAEAEKQYWEDIHQEWLNKYPNKVWYVHSVSYSSIASFSYPYEDKGEAVSAAKEKGGRVWKCLDYMTFKNTMWYHNCNAVSDSPPFPFWSNNYEEVES